MAEYSTFSFMLFANFSVTNNMIDDWLFGCLSP